jgi:hypothetical protein
VLVNFPVVSTYCSMGTSAYQSDRLSGKPRHAAVDTMYDWRASYGARLQTSVG